MSLWGHLEQGFGTEPRKLLALDDEAMAGLVHLIACHRGATESQSLKHLGFPDATLVSTRTWVCVADEVQKIQIVFLANCRDETTTRRPRLLEWLAQVQEEMRLSARAAARSRIVRAIAREAAVQPQVPASELKKSKRSQISQTQSQQQPSTK